MLDELRGVVAPFTTPSPRTTSWTFRRRGTGGLVYRAGRPRAGRSGSAGERHALTREEHRDLLFETVRAADGRVSVVAGIISNSMRDTAARGRQVSGVGVLTSPTREGQKAGVRSALASPSVVEEALPAAE